jgi:hypothetical protein
VRIEFHDEKAAGQLVSVLALKYRQIDQEQQQHQHQHQRRQVEGSCDKNLRSSNKQCADQSLVTGQDAAPSAANAVCNVTIRAFARSLRVARTAGNKITYVHTYEVISAVVYHTPTEFLRMGL